ncbi:MAG: ABC transporter ATP-binding protein [Eubacteriaceae bacterium]|nr:ABC transporter ATP-binding protein [Eubacteriaceae bacterium]
MEPLLEVKHLDVDFFIEGAAHRAVSDFSFHLESNEALGIVGESGSGKSVASLAIMGLLPKGSSRVGGQALLNGRNLLTLSETEMRGVRGKEISMIFQEPMTSLNPVHSCGRQIMEPLLLHIDFDKKQAKERAIDLLSQCGVPDPKRRFSEYPHQLSGGLRQRVMIAMALACNPSLLIADEPTTALDVTIQAQILELFKDLRQQKDTGIILITHDLGVVYGFCESVIVVYAGQIVESGPTKDLFASPLHPYTRGLMAALPVLGGAKTRLASIEGIVPDLASMPSGCRFHPRCPYKTNLCVEAEPPLATMVDGRQSKCHRGGLL